jgi:hypothetical protein
VSAAVEFVFENLSDLEGWVPALGPSHLASDPGLGEEDEDAVDDEWRRAHADVLEEVEMDLFLHSFEPEQEPKATPRLPIGGLQPSPEQRAYERKLARGWRPRTLRGMPPAVVDTSDRR